MMNIGLDSPHRELENVSNIVLGDSLHSVENKAGPHPFGQLQDGILQVDIPFRGRNRSQVLQVDILSFHTLPLFDKVKTGIDHYPEQVGAELSAKMIVANISVQLQESHLDSILGILPLAENPESRMEEGLLVAVEDHLVRTHIIFLTAPDDSFFLH